MADHRHKRDTNARSKSRATLVAGPVAVLATVSAVTFGVLAGEPSATGAMTTTSAPTSALTEAASDAATTRAADRDRVVSRSTARTRAPEPLTPLERLLSRKATQRAVRGADTRLWTTAPLSLWARPGKKAEKLGLVDEAVSVRVTGRRFLGREEIVVDAKPRWVAFGYLSSRQPQPEPAPAPAPQPAQKKPAPAARPAPAPAPAPATCNNGTSVASGVSPNVVEVHQAVCAAFPEITTYGTFRSDGEHAQGIAVDIMVSGDRGWQVAELLRARAGELGVNYLIYSQQIWSVERSGEGWRGMEDRGSTTANHYDHVHVTTY